MNLLYSVDNVTADAMVYLASHMNMYDENKPRTLSNVASLPRPVVATTMSWHSSERVKPITRENELFLQQFIV